MAALPKMVTRSKQSTKKGALVKRRPPPLSKGDTAAESVGGRGARSVERAAQYATDANKVRLAMQGSG